MALSAREIEQLGEEVKRLATGDELIRATRLISDSGKKMSTALNLMMGTYSGYDLYGKFRKIDKGVVMMIGGSVQKELVIAGKAAGVNGISLANLLATVSEESDFKAVKESRHYTPTRARAMFGALRKLTNRQISALVAAGDDMFFETVYGPTSSRGRRLGNVHTGDGARFPGRGIFQLTGYDTYYEFTHDSGINVLKEPDLLVSDTDVSVKSAIWFWKKRIVAAGADRDIIRATRIVNPRLADVSDRIAASKLFATAIA